METGGETILFYVSEEFARGYPQGRTWTKTSRWCGP